MAIAECAFAELAPTITRVRQVGAEHHHGVAVRAQRFQADGLLAGPQISQEILNVRRAPLPRKLTCELLKPFQQPAALFDGFGREGSREHLCAPAVQHRSENPFVGLEQPDVLINQHPRDETIHRNP
ncbi:hypothetical protein [Arthrobacter sp. efr-133-TYG-104]|uniref:hypothetical protein n=1 Tax=Arthrobacter sp. efr-133-TYG-104 TaxID=3040324 RepID=UPI00254F95B9|nr:hypothetical protein [Arthrobacter sp. efr-133-TYG-104]